MQRPPFRLAAGLRRIAPAAALLLLAAAGCDAILGLHDVSPDPSGGSGGSGGSGVSATTQGGGGTTSNGGNGGTGGVQQGDFDFAAASPETDLPLAGQSFVDVEIDPNGGFSGPVTITLKLAPTGVTFEGTTLAAGQTKGRIKLGAEAPATLGQQLDLTLVASSGELSHEAMIHGTVTGTPGTLVDAFGEAGITSWTLAMDDGNVYDVREVAQNKILTTGDSLPGLASNLKGSRVLVGGTMDASFGPGGDGVVSTQFCGCSKSSYGTGVFRLLNGNVLMVGTGNKGSGFTNDIALLRLKDNGTPDVIGGDAGQALVDLGGAEYTFAVELSADEHVVAAGGRDGGPFVARFDTQGNLDPSFGAGAGFVAPGVAGAGVSRALLIDSQQRIVVAADANFGSDVDIFVDRLLPDGSSDPSWAGGGVFSYGGTGQQNAVAIARQADGKIVVAGRTEENGDGDVLLLRINDDGTLDTSFGSGGKTVLDGAGGDLVLDMVMLPDGRVVAGGVNDDGSFLTRFLADGTPDPTFGTAGYRPIFLGSKGLIEAMTLGTNNRIILAGKRESQPVKGFVAKVWN